MRKGCRALTLLADSEEEDGAEYTSLTMFLAAVGLHDWAPKVRPHWRHALTHISPQFIRERIDLEALMLLSEGDLGEVLPPPGRPHPPVSRSGCRWARGRSCSRLSRREGEAVLAV
jgi:hypothetical protein